MSVRKVSFSVVACDFAGCEESKNVKTEDLGKGTKVRVGTRFATPDLCATHEAALNSYLTANLPGVSWKQSDGESGSHSETSAVVTWLVSQNLRKAGQAGRISKEHLLAYAAAHQGQSDAEKLAESQPASDDSDSADEAVSESSDEESSESDDSSESESVSEGEVVSA